VIITSFRIPFALPTLNELEAARGKIAAGSRAGDSTRWNQYNETKRRLQADVVSHIIAQRVPKLPPPEIPYRLQFTWTCADRRSDPDNIAAGGRKILLDAMARLRVTRGAFRTVSAGIIHCDGWHCIGWWQDFFDVGPPSRVGVEVRIYGGG